MRDILKATGAEGQVGQGGAGGGGGTCMAAGGAGGAAGGGGGTWMLSTDASYAAMASTQFHSGPCLRDGYQ
eukprot:CAMPEP_0184650506 /NCGR_PEP_ID=MMETSP0308-20130426/8039_1 /TAXON_ID=38269 /ORGANISM="Gloeochaete witrockiana, Strain SAG 46.84" /LENGTH=70 /DNA_ID=CAMNT_0027084067 /DNA_START=157 /DNA_END=368 /DNA_ORIENTATION=-